MRVLFFSLLLVFSLHTIAFGWGTDIPIWTAGKVNAFDVDYNKSTGTMYVAFQPEGRDKIWLYYSTDHGYNWKPLSKSLSTSCKSGVSDRSGIKKLRLIYDDTTGRIYLFFVDKDGYLCGNYLSSPDATVLYKSRVSSDPISEKSFDVAINFQTGRLVVMYMQGTDAGDPVYIKVSDNGSTWTTESLTTWTYGGDYRASLSFGPPDNFYLAFSTLKYGGGDTSFNLYEIAIKRSTTNGSTWSGSTRLTTNSTNDYNPVVAAANKDDSGVWVVYGEFSTYNTYALYYNYSADGGQNWSSKKTLFESSQAIAYVQDIKPYKIKPNNYVDLLYTVWQGSLIDLYFVWTSISSPYNWHTPVKVNDQNVYIGMPGGGNDIGAKLLYSPGAPQSGGGAVFSYYTTGGLYFDAPWIGESYVLTVNSSGTGSGTVISDPEGINCGSDCSARYSSTTAVNLIASASAGSTFEGWGGDCASCGSSTSCVVTMDSDKVCTAVFNVVVNYYNLQITINGPGRVRSQTGGVNCENTNPSGSATCSYNFPQSQSVSLSAEALDGVNFISSFAGWSGDCSGSSTECNILMNADKTVIATFNADFLADVPSGQHSFSYSPVETPEINHDPSVCKPFAVGNVDSGNLNLQVGLPKFTAAVDVYLAIYAPHIVEDIFLFWDDNSIHSISEGLRPWKENLTDRVNNESLYGDISTAGLPEGTYYLGVVVTPAGDADDGVLDNYYLWVTYFVILP